MQVKQLLKQLLLILDFHTTRGAHASLGHVSWVEAAVRGRRPNGGGREAAAGPARHRRTRSASVIRGLLGLFGLLGLAEVAIVPCNRRPRAVEERSAAASVGVQCSTACRPQS